MCLNLIPVVDSDFFFVYFSHFIIELKIHHLNSFITLTMTLTVLILAVCGMPVTYKLGQMTKLLFMSSCSSVDRAPARHLGGHGFNSCRIFSLSHAYVILISSLFIFQIYIFNNFKVHKTLTASLAAASYK